MVYFIAFLASLPIVIFSFFLLKHIEENQERTTGLKLNDLIKAFKKFVTNNQLFATALVEMAIYFNFGVLETYLPIYMHNHGFSAQSIGLIFTLQILSIALTKPLFGKLADRANKRIQIIFGMIILITPIIAMSFLHNYYLIMLLSIVFGLGMSLATIATNSYVGDIVKTEELGSSMGALSSIMDIGHSSGPFIAGFIITYYSFEFSFLAAAAVGTLTTIYLFFNKRGLAQT
jgi:MFS transporter, DHA1 family, multidrug resistance protein